MKKIKWHLLLLAAFGLCAGYMNKPPKVTQKTRQTMDTYEFAYSASGKWYYGSDLTSLGARLGIDYDCTQDPGVVCTFIANPAAEHEDTGGTFFYTTDIPNSGITYGAFSWF